MTQGVGTPAHWKTRIAGITGIVGKVGIFVKFVVSFSFTFGECKCFTEFSFAMAMKTMGQSNGMCRRITLTNRQ